MISFKYDKEGDLLEIRFSESKVAESEYLEDVGVVLDYDESNRIVAIEILSFSKRKSMGNLSEKDDLLEAVAI